MAGVKKAKIWQNLFLKAFEVILCQKVVFQNSGKLQYTGIFAADGAMPLYWSSTVVVYTLVYATPTCPVKLLEVVDHCHATCLCKCNGASLSTICKL